MQVFKLFFQIINKNKISVFMTLIIAFAFSILFVKNTGDSFTIQRANIAIVDNDNSEASKALTNYMEERTDIKDINSEDIEEAIFYQDIVYVLYIPKGYEEAIKANEEIVLEKKQVPDSVSAYVVDNYVDTFTNTVRSHYVYASNPIMKEAIQKANVDLALEVTLESVTGEDKEPIQYFFNFLCYSFFCSLIWGLGVVMIAMNKVDIKRRNAVSPISNLKMNIQLALGASIFGIVLFGLSCLFAFTVFGEGMKTIGSYLYLINLVVLIFPCLGLAYLIASAIKKPEAINGISNIVCLALAFLGGCFVPQVMLSESVLTIAKFTPSYWFVNTNDKIFALTSLNDKALFPIYQNMLILLGFGVVFFTLAFMFNKIKRKNIL